MSNEMTPRPGGRLARFQVFQADFRRLYGAAMLRRRGDNLLPSALAWFDSGLAAPEAIRWLIAGYGPTEAAALAGEGVDPSDAIATRLMAMDALDGGHRMAEAEALATALQDAIALAAIDPDSPDEVVIRIDSC